VLTLAVHGHDLAGVGGELLVLVLADAGRPVGSPRGTAGLGCATGLARTALSRRPHTERS